MVVSAPDWSDSNLRRRSFRSKNLAGANFQGADLRGCDFRGANLQGANLAQAKIGLAPESLAWGSLLILGSGALAFHILSQLIFGILGIGASDPNYGLRIALISILATVGVLMGLTSSQANQANQTHSSPLMGLAALLEGALLGFFVGGSISELSLTPAIGGSVIGAILFVLGIYRLSGTGFGMIVRTIGLAMTNGIFLIAGINTLQLFSVQRYLPTFIWLLVTVLFWLSTVRVLGSLFQDLQQMGWTSFANADLTQVRWK